MKMVSVTGRTGSTDSEVDEWDCIYTLFVLSILLLYKLVFGAILSQLKRTTSIYQHYSDYTVLWSINNIGCVATMADYTAQQYDYGVLPPTTELSGTTI